MENVDPTYLQLFVRFAVFESALKRSGFLRGDEDFAEPAWNDFAAALGEQFYERALEQQSLAPVFERAPRQEIVRTRDEGGTSVKYLDTKTVDPPADSASLIKLLKRVRNNLFHGRKLVRPDEDDLRFVACALAILRLIEDFVVDIDRFEEFRNRLAHLYADLGFTD